MSFHGRLEEKSQEIQSLRGMLTSESQRIDHLLHELDATRAELKAKSLEADELRQDGVVKADELRAMQQLERELDEVKQARAEATAQLFGERQAKAALQQKLEQTSMALDAANAAIRDKEYSVQSSQSEINRLSLMSNELNDKAQAMERVIRENEKLQMAKQTLQEELAQVTKHCEETRSALAASKAEVAEQRAAIAKAEQATRDAQTRLETEHVQVGLAQQQAQHERERYSAVEAALTEQRQLVAATKEELHAVREAKTVAERVSEEADDAVLELKESLGRACAMAFEAMRKWDDLLGSILDAEVFGDIVAAATGTSTGAGTRRGSRGFDETQQQGRRRQSRAGIDDDDDDDFDNNFDDDYLYGSDSDGGDGDRRGGGGGGGRHSFASRPAGGLHSSGRKQRHHGHGSRGHGNSGHHGRGLLSLTPEQLLQRVAVRIERVSLKVERTRRIRANFQAQGEKLVAALQGGLQAGHERVALYFHKISDAQQKLQQMKDVVDRDRKKHETETQELRNFKDVVIAQHSIQIRDAELRYTQQAQLLQEEKGRSEALVKENGQLQGELRTLQQKNSHLQEDMQHLDQAEKFVGELSSRVAEMSDINRSLASENEQKTSSIAQLTQQNNEYLLERSSLVARLQTLEAHLQSKDETIRECDGKLDRLLREIERLRSRQIHPDLAQTLVETQGILQNAARASSLLSAPPGGVGGSRTGIAEGEYGGATAAAATAMAEHVTHLSEVLGEYVHAAQQVESMANELINRSSEMVSRFEVHLYSSRHHHSSSAGGGISGSGGMLGSSGVAMNTRSRASVGGAFNEHMSAATEQALATMKEEIHDLLDANARLAIHVQQVASDLKKGIRRLDPTARNGGGSAPGSPVGRMDERDRGDRTLFGGGFGATDRLRGSGGGGGSGGGSEIFTSIFTGHGGGGGMSTRRVPLTPAFSSSSGNEAINSNSRQLGIHLDDLHIHTTSRYHQSKQQQQQQSQQLQQSSRRSDSRDSEDLSATDRLSAAYEGAYTGTGGRNGHGTGVGAGTSVGRVTGGVGYGNGHADSASTRVAFTPTVGSYRMSSGGGGVGGAEGTDAGLEAGASTRSSGRLNKLGSDLDALARRLDAFDSSSRHK